MDLNIVYDKRKTFKARLIDKLHKMVLAKMIENKVS